MSTDLHQGTSSTAGTSTSVSLRFAASISQSNARIILNAAAAVDETNSIIRDARTRYLRALGLSDIGDDYTDEEEQEWNALFAQPHVQAGLDRLEEEAMRQFRAGKTREGGFALE
jgi:hypothetical protein